MIQSLIRTTRSKVQQSQTIQSSLWVAIGMLSGQLIRLGSNLILTRLLVPDFFGIMAIVYSVLSFFTMMTDIGLTPSVYNTKRDSEPSFVNTVWSIQIISSIIVSSLVIIAAYPISLTYSEPLLFPLLVVAALSSLFAGFNSVSILLEQKYIRQKKIVICQVVAQFLGAAAMILVAFFTGSIWALILGNLLSTALILWSSYSFFSYKLPKFELEKSAVSEIIHFGKWIFVSSIFSYIATHSRPIILGFWLSMSQLGVFVIAGTLATIVEMIANTLSSKILQPKYRLLVVEKNYQQICNIRFKFILLFLPPTILIAVSGEYIVSLLYDDRYSWAGPLLQLITIGKISTLLIHTSRPLLASLGDSKSLMLTQGYTAVISLSLIYLSGHYMSVDAMMCVLAILPFIDYCILRYRFKRHNIKLFQYDFPVISASILIIISTWYLTSAKSLDIVIDVISTIQQ